MFLLCDKNTSKTFDSFKTTSKCVGLFGSNSSTLSLRSENNILFIARKSPFQVFLLISLKKKLKITEYQNYYFRGQCFCQLSCRILQKIFCFFVNKNLKKYIIRLKQFVYERFSEANQMLENQSNVQTVIKRTPPKICKADTVRCFVSAYEQ